MSCAQAPRGGFGGEAVGRDAHGRQRLAPAAEFGIDFAQHADDLQFGRVAAPAEAQALPAAPTESIARMTPEARRRRTASSVARTATSSSRTRDNSSSMASALIVAARRGEARLDQARLQAQSLRRRLARGRVDRGLRGGVIIEFKRGVRERQLKARPPAGRDVPRARRRRSPIPAAPRPNRASAKRHSRAKAPPMDRQAEPTHSRSARASSPRPSMTLAAPRISRNSGSSSTSSP